MNDSAVSIEMLKDILVDPDFESVCPPLTEDEFSLLEQNILLLCTGLLFCIIGAIKRRLRKNEK